MKFEKAIPYGIKIEPTINGGFIVSVGCSVTLAFGDLKQLRKASEEYFADPKKVHEEYKKAAPPITGGGDPPQVPMGMGGGLTGGQEQAAAVVGSLGGRRY